MKIYAPMMKKNENEKISPRFARADYFAIVNTETKEIEFVDNPYLTHTHGAGTQVLMWCIDGGASAIIADQLGPNALSVVKANPLKAYLSNGLKINEIADAVINNSLPKYPEDRVAPGRGMGQGRGAGQGRGNFRN